MRASRSLAVTVASPSRPAQVVPGDPVAALGVGGEEEHLLRPRQLEGEHQAGVVGAGVELERQRLGRVEPVGSRSGARGHRPARSRRDRDRRRLPGRGRSAGRRRRLRSEGELERHEEVAPERRRAGARLGAGGAGEGEGVRSRPGTPRRRAGPRRRSARRSPAGRERRRGRRRRRRAESARRPGRGSTQPWRAAAFSLSSFIACLLTDFAGSSAAASIPARPGRSSPPPSSSASSASRRETAGSSSPTASASSWRAPSSPRSWSRCGLRSSLASASSGSSVQASHVSSISNSREVRLVLLPDAVEMVLMLVGDDRQVELAAARGVARCSTDVADPACRGRGIRRASPVCSRSRSARSRAARRPRAGRRAGSSRRGRCGTCARWRRPRAAAGGNGRRQRTSSTRCSRANGSSRAVGALGARRRRLGVRSPSKALPEPLPRPRR